MLQYIALATAIIITVIISIITFLYVYLTRKELQQQGNIVSNEQLYIQENRKTYGIKSNGTSMEIREIYAVPPSDLGL